MGFFRNRPVKRFILFPMPCIDAIVTDHFEVLFGNVPDEPLNEFKGGDLFYHKFVVFMPVIMESDGVPIIVINAGSGDHRTSEVAPNILSDNLRMREIGFCVNIKAFGAVLVDVRFHLFKRRTETLLECIEQSSAESITEERVIKMSYFTPETVIADPAFRN